MRGRKHLVVILVVFHELVVDIDGCDGHRAGDLVGDDLLHCYSEFDDRHGVGHLGPCPGCPGR